MINRFTLVLVSLLGGLLFLVFPTKNRSSDPEYDRTVCAGPPLKSVEARNDALEKGYLIDRKYDCIDKNSFDEINRRAAEWQAAQKEAQLAAPDAPAAEAELILGEARKGFQTAVSLPGSGSPPLPQPPAGLFVRTDYRSAQNLLLAAYVTPDPKDGDRHPAIIWLTGGDTNSLGDFWRAGPEFNDQSARAYRDAGLVVMFPTLRGGNTNAGGKEYFLGEVDDVLAAADHLARLPYVDPNQIYLGGHSTGGTLALLTAETSGRFGAVFAFGPVAAADRYSSSQLPVNFRQHGELELKLRSPIHWLSGISTPTYVIEGRNAPGNFSDFEEICRGSRNPLLHCIPVEGSDHFSVLARVSRVIAARLAVRAGGIEFALRPDDFAISSENTAVAPPADAPVAEYSPRASSAAKQARRVVAAADESTTMRAVDPAIEKAVIGVMGIEALVQQTQTFCLRTLPTSYAKYSTAENWQQRNAAVIAQQRRVLSQAFDASQRQALEATVQATVQRQMAPVVDAPMASRIKWCDQSSDEINNGSVDLRNKQNLVSPLMNYRPEPS